MVPTTNREDRTVAIDYSFEKGNLVYFGEITILGNTKTHDKVIRRELKFKEGELYSGSKFRESRENGRSSPHANSNVWCSGKTLSTRSFSVSGNSAANDASREVKFSCESITPFGSPVVPLV